MPDTSFFFTIPVDTSTATITTTNYQFPPSPLTDGAYDFIIVEPGVTITVFEDSAATNLLTAKNLSGVPFASERLLSSGTGKTIKKLTFSGGLIS